LLTDHEEGVGGSGSNSALPVREAQPAVVSQAETTDETSSSGIPSGEIRRTFTSMRDPGRSNIDRSQLNVGDQPTQTGQGPSQAEAQTRAYLTRVTICVGDLELVDVNVAVVGDPTVDSGPRNAESDEPRMIGDFDGSAREFWNLYIDEAKSDDDAQINTVKEGMDSDLIFVRSRSTRQYGLEYAYVWPHRPVYFLLLSQHL
jgi:hypothetical protein